MTQQNILFALKCKDTTIRFLVNITYHTNKMAGNLIDFMPYLLPLCGGKAPEICDTNSSGLTTLKICTVLKISICIILHKAISASHSWPPLYVAKRL